MEREIIEQEITPTRESVTMEYVIVPASEYAEIKSVTDRCETDIFRIVFETINMYDLYHNTIFVTSQDIPTEDTTSQFSRGTVYMGGYHGYILLSTYGNQAGYFSVPHAYDRAGNEIEGIAFEDGTVRSETGYRFGKVVNIPEGTYKITFRYRTYSTNPYKTLVQFPMVTQGTTIASEDYIEYFDHLAVTDIVSTGMDMRPIYVSTTGSDDNDGWSFGNALATFTEAFKRTNVVYAERGVYNEKVVIERKKHVRIYPYNNDDWIPTSDPHYVAGTPRQLIEFNGGYTVAKQSLATDDGLYLINDYDGGINFTPVFETGAQNARAYPEATAHPKDIIYRCNVVVHLKNEGKLKLAAIAPDFEHGETWDDVVLTDNSFTWNPNTKVLKMNIATEDFDSVTVLDHVAGLTIDKCTDVVLSDVAVKYTYSTCISVNDSDDVTLVNCEGSYSGSNCGIQFNSVNGKLVNCTARENAIDGFNFHEFGVSEIVDCRALWNYDDGCSHHSMCIGTVNGGEFAGNGKGGMTPAYGAVVNVYNILARANDTYGIAYLYDSGSGMPATGLVSSCACVGNKYGIKVEQQCKVNAINLKFSGNTTDKLATGILNEY